MENTKRDIEREEHTMTFDEPLNAIRQEERLKIILDALISVKSRKWIIDKYTKEWQCGASTIKTLIDEAYVYMRTQTLDKDAVRNMSVERLEELYNDKSAQVKDKIKIIDTINRAFGVYEQTVNIGNKDDEEIKFDLGI